jgi:putative membrane protein
VSLANFGMFNGDWGGVEVLFGLAWLAFWGAVVFLLVRLLRRGPAGTRPSSAVRVLEERYARGEIDRDEFFERRRVLLGETSSPPAAGEP